MKIAIGCDHGGFILKHEIMDYLNKNGYEILDFGTDSDAAVDYSDFGEAVARCVVEGKANLGILMCGTGIGISISANKVPGARCALLSDVFSAKATRLHNDANMIAMGGRVIGAGLALEIVDAFLHTPFSGDERHVRRISKITDIEKKYSC
ncbi:MAG: ribose 5-phosphate isomerase B [Eubacteriales bacterium]